MFGVGGRAGRPPEITTLTAQLKTMSRTLSTSALLLLLAAGLTSCAGTQTIVRGPCVRTHNPDGPEFRCSSKQALRIEVRFR